MGASLMRGIVPAVVTPFRDNEAIDYGAWQGVLDRLIASGVHGLFVAGGQGEFFALSEEERTVAARFCAQTVAGRVPLYVNAGAITTAETVRLAQQAAAEGADFIVVVTPYYLRPSADELVEHYSEVCRSVSLPVLAYNIPQFTGVDLEPEVVARVAAACENFAGLKDSSGRVERIPEWKRAGAAVFMGRDEFILDGLRMGCVGAVTAGANLAPKAYVDLFNAYQAGDLEEATRVQTLVDMLAKALTLGTFPVVVKEAMHMAGMPVGACRRPAGPLKEEARRQLSTLLERLREAGYLPSYAELARGRR
jgi:4-hydroxy-tetrahydrodipicolinate synthase